MLVRDIFFIFIFMLSSIEPTAIHAAEESAGYYFFGKILSQAVYEPWKWRANGTLQLFFKTASKKSKMMMFYQDEKTHGQYMDLFLLKGKARFRVKMGQEMQTFEERFINQDFADSKWHEVKIELSEKEIRFSINDTKGILYSAEPIPFTEYNNPSNIVFDDYLFVAGLTPEKMDKSSLAYPGLFDEVYGGSDVFSFEGCIGSIKFNRIPNGRLDRGRLQADPKEAVDNCTGACATRPQRCSNGGRCIDNIKDSECDCTGTGFEGESCEKRSTTVFVSDKGAHISYRLGNENPLRSSERNTLDFQFLTEAMTDGVFFYMGGKKDHLLVELVNGSVRAQANVGGDTVELQSGGDLSDSCWHYVEVKRRRTRLTLIVDEQRASGNSSKTFKTLNLNNHSAVIYFGGGPEKKLYFAKSKTLSFKGFLRKFRFEGINILDKALEKKNGFSETGVNLIFENNVMLQLAKSKCETNTVASGCSPVDDDDSDSCTTVPPTATLGSMEPRTSTPSPRVAPTIRKTQPPIDAKFKDPTPRPKGVSAWVIIVIVLGAMAVVFITVFILYRWNHRYTGSFKPSKNEEGQVQEPGSESTEQQSARSYNQPTFYMYKPPKKPNAESLVSI